MAGYTREVARRIFAQEFRESNLTFKDGNEAMKAYLYPAKLVKVEMPKTYLKQ